eukprot:CAMPEP_0170588604 /NCGR_PEP_ID=MMETSP0224-20130122/10920_1 /TAXON_ID=285029 /ORGANISM="Togula jolla, Strain CCCM 725" /LENGTH=288 /DNA_ID=CAMNT_0010912335 /DNA_START=113 /DNA_END=979 /DNA_ORIENTATION=-
MARKIKELEEIIENPVPHHQEENVQVPKLNKHKFVCEKVGQIVKLPEPPLDEEGVCIEEFITEEDAHHSLVDEPVRVGVPQASKDKNLDKVLEKMEEFMEVLDLQNKANHFSQQIVPLIDKLKCNTEGLELLFDKIEKMESKVGEIFVARDNQVDRVDAKLLHEVRDTEKQRNATEIVNEAFVARNKQTDGVDAVKQRGASSTKKKKKNSNETEIVETFVAHFWKDVSGYNSNVPLLVPKNQMTHWRTGQWLDCLPKRLRPMYAHMTQDVEAKILSALATKLAEQRRC